VTQERLSSWQMQRTGSNEAAVVQALTRAVQQYNAGGVSLPRCRSLQFQVLDLGYLRFYPEQMFELSR
jgi:hypothetical protein